MFGNFFTSAINYFRGANGGMPSNGLSNFGTGADENAPVNMNELMSAKNVATGDEFDWKGFGQMGVQAMGNAYKANQANKQAPKQAPAIEFNGGQNAAQGAAAQRIQQLTQFDKQAGRFSKEMPRF